MNWTTDRDRERKEPIETTGSRNARRKHRKNCVIHSSHTAFETRWWKVYSIDSRIAQCGLTAVRVKFYFLQISRCCREIHHSFLLIFFYSLFVRYIRFDLLFSYIFEYYFDSFIFKFCDFVHDWWCIKADHFLEFFCVKSNEVYNVSRKWIFSVFSLVHIINEKL